METTTTGIQVARVRVSALRQKMRRPSCANNWAFFVTTFAGDAHTQSVELGENEVDDAW
ncbi:MAG: hypothetical protein CALGDGBN_01947 [Pseudomonadales bacterium]|nr:hypothetical protein [Pseudomonadales bacterium]